MEKQEIKKEIVQMNNHTTDNRSVYQLFKGTQDESSVRQIPDMRIEVKSCGRLTDLANAKRFMRIHFHKAKYCYDQKAWYIWNNVIWKRDNTGEIYLLAKQVVQLMYQDASQIEDNNERIKFASWIKQCESFHRRKTMIEDAESELAITTDSLDRDLNYITCLNKTIDLTTGDAMEPQLEHFITKQMNVTYDPSADCPKWLELLNIVFDNDNDLIKYFQKAVGYALTGDTGAECFFLLIGGGENGKSTIVRTLAAMFGDYAYKTPIDTLIATQGANKKPALAHLKGVRFLYASESESGDKLSIATIKELTGGEVITGCHKYEKELSFLPQCTLFFSSNNEPIITGTDLATWRRIVKIPFNVRISDKVDKLRPKEEIIAELEEELPGIFNWALEGLMYYREEGLNDKPSSVSDAINRYRDEQDSVNSFFDEKCIINRNDQHIKTQISELYQAYTEWEGDNKELKLNKIQFGKELKQKGFTQDRTGHSRSWLGIGLRENDE